MAQGQSRPLAKEEVGPAKMAHAHEISESEASFQGTTSQENHWFCLMKHRFLTYPELTTAAIVQFQDVSFSRHRGQRRLFPGQRGAVVVGATLLQL